MRGPREQLPVSLGLADEVPAPLDGYAGQVFAALVSRGAALPQEIVAATRLIPTQVEMGLSELAGHGLVTADSFAALRGLIVPPSRAISIVSIATSLLVAFRLGPAVTLAGHALKVGQAQYSALLTLEGTFLDDMLIHRMAPTHFLLVVNAGNVAKDRVDPRADRQYWRGSRRY